MSTSSDAPRNGATGFRCIVCEERRGKPWLRECRDLYLQMPHVVDFWRCCNCELVQQYPLPSDTSAFYRQYPVHQKKGRAYQLLRANVMARSYFRPTSQDSTLRLLDFGCGDGWFLSICKGKLAELSGFEPDTGHASTLSAALDIRIESDLGELHRSMACGFDIVTMHQVLEHLTDPDAAFASAATLLKPGGRLFIVIPDLGSREARWFGRKWHGLDPPRHISFPTPVAIGRLAARHGFDIEDSRALPFPPALAGSLCNLVAGRFGSKLFMLFMPLALAVHFAFGGSARSYLLRKPSARIRTSDSRAHDVAE